MMLLNTVSTMTSECFLVRSDTRETSSTSSAFVMLPPVISLLRRSKWKQEKWKKWKSRFETYFFHFSTSLLFHFLLSVAEVVSECGRAGARTLLVVLPIGSELVVL